LRIFSLGAAKKVAPEDRIENCGPTTLVNLPRPDVFSASGALEAKLNQSTVAELVEA